MARTFGALQLMTISVLLSACTTTASPPPPDPARILAAATTNLASAHFVHVVIATREPAGLIADVDVASPDALHGYLSLGSAIAEVVLYQHVTYVRGIAAIRNFYGPAVSAAVTNHWVQLSAGTRPNLGLGVLANLPALARCITLEHGPLTAAGSTTINGLRVQIINDSGGRPGSTPATLYVTRDQPAELVKLVQTGPKQSGGTDASCDSKGEAGTTTAELVFTFATFDNSFEIYPPPDPMAFPVVN